MLLHIRSKKQRVWVRQTWKFTTPFSSQRRFVCSIVMLTVWEHGRLRTGNCMSTADRAGLKRGIWISISTITNKIDLPQMTQIITDAFSGRSPVTIIDICRNKRICFINRTLLKVYWMKPWFCLLIFLMSFSVYAQLPTIVAEGGSDKPMNWPEIKKV